MKDIGKRTIQISIALGAIVGLLGCAPEQPSDVESASHDFGFLGPNGLVMVNGFFSTNGFLASNGFLSTNGLINSNGLITPNGLINSNGLLNNNGLLATNGLMNSNGLLSTNGLMTTTAGRKTVSYLVKCALSASDSLVKQDQNGTNYTFAGGIGLCPSWKSGAISGSVYNQCMESLSACMTAHINTAGVHVPLWLDSLDSAIGWGVDRTNYPMQEGTFFGDIMDTGNLSNQSHPNTTGPVAYYCDGAGFPAGAAGTVAGRIGANQVNSPYTNPFGTGTLCQNASQSVGQYSNGTVGSCPNGSLADPQGGCPDGYKALTTSDGAVWQHGITVWRNPNYTPQFDPAYVYSLSPIGASSLLLDSESGYLTDAAGSPLLTTSEWMITAHGSNWIIQMKSDTTKCVDANAAINGTTVHVNPCSGVASQDWTFTAQPTRDGAFLIQTAATGNRCLHVKNGSTSANAGMEVYDCSPTSSFQRFNVQAVAIPN